ncbi:hypothetical protein [Nocardioides sp. TF02-7]|uniref:gamma carbonic anhydrase family protein n=1 Tax=Nocardioides sp. TF02-7 TaxID=2917724 RepID=UPI001F060787|nr:hypothetical protein [Nocardioides sp. TF02-7]UMG91264.1 hypothetical protein MF408_13885 [Nocardioides sp. TF02-7]
MVHSASIGAEALIGNHATVLDGAVVGSRAMVAAGAVVTPGTVVPEETLAVGAPARVRGPLSENHWVWVRRNPGEYQKLAQWYAADLAEVDDA